MWSVNYRTRPNGTFPNPTSDPADRKCPRWNKLAIACFLLLFLPGCIELDYYLHSATGHLQVISKRQSISDLLNQKDTPEQLQRRLEQIEQIRDFASQALGLPDNGSYRSFVKLDRPYVLWNVVAAPELSLKPLEWCFPVVGCLSYRGYFEESQAEQFAHQLNLSGHDTIIVGVPAYSTLSWFDDPVLSSFSDWPITSVAKLIFHELAHQQLYISGDTAFNESFATAVEHFGVTRWLEQADNPAMVQTYAISQHRQQQFLQLLDSTRETLEQLYSSQQSAQLKRQQKQKIFATMRENYQQLKTEWQGYSGYDIWFQQLNNARFAATDNYQRWVPAFQLAMAQEKHDFAGFYQRSQAIANLPAEQRQLLLDRLVQENRSANGK